MKVCVLQPRYTFDEKDVEKCYEGVRFGFLTCYDFYFYENYAQLARQNLGIINGSFL